MQLCPNCDHRGTERRCPECGFPTVDEDRLKRRTQAPDLTGQVFEERYEVDTLIGSGTTGWVYKAVHRTMRHEVALKVLRREMLDDLRAIKRFYQEARASSQLKHPHAIQVYDFGESEDGFLFMAMEFLRGQSLRELILEQGALSQLRAVRIVRQVCEALDVAHEMGLVHRDLKPENVFLCDVHRKEDFAKVLDFGMSKFIDGEQSKETAGVTLAGWVVGSPGYMAPEQAKGERLDRRADLYALGVMLYELLTGVLPFRASSVEELLAERLTSSGEPMPEEVDGEPIAEELRNLVHRLMAIDKNDRPESAAQVDEALGTIEQALLPPGATVSGTPASESNELLRPRAQDSRTLATAGERVLAPQTGRRNGYLVAAFVAAVTIALALVVALSGDPQEDSALTSPQVPKVENVAPREISETAAAQPEEAEAESPPTPAAASDSAEAKASPDATATVSRVAEAEPPPTPPAAEPEPPKTRKVWLLSDPPEAIVRQDGKIVGKTPFGVDLAQGEVRGFALEKADYEVTEAALDDDSPSEVKVTLKKTAPTSIKKKKKKKKKGLEVKIL